MIFRRTHLVRTLTLLLTALAGGFGLVGCGDGADDRRTDTLVVATQADAKTLDPHEAGWAGSMRLLENIHAGLMRYGDEYGQIEKDLLVDYRVNEEHTRFELTLRDDATFHSGRAVTAEDVRFSLLRISEANLRSEPLAHLESIEVVDDRTLVVNLSEPMTPLMTYFAHPMYAIVDRQAVQANDGKIERGMAVGCGPFKLALWQKDRRAELVRHEGYHHKGLPRVARLIFRPIADEQARTVALANGEVDIVLHVPAREIESLDEQADVTVASRAGTFWEYIGINTARPPFDDARVRQAIAWAIDREALARAVKRGHATAYQGGHIPPYHWASADFTMYQHRDIDRARQLLDQAGHANGVSGELIVAANVQYQVDAAVMVKQMLADAGINITVQRLEGGQFGQRLGERDFDMTLVGWTGFVDPDEWTYPLFHTDGKYNQQNYSNPQVDSLLEAGRRTADREQRQRLYAQAQRLITEDAPMVFLYYNDHTSAWRAGVSDFDVRRTIASTPLRRAHWSR